MIRIFKAKEQNLQDMLDIRMEMLRESDNNYNFTESFIKSTEDFFKTADHSTMLAYDDENIIGCATMCYFNALPTSSCQTTKRCYLMNLYTKKDFRKQGIASTMLYMLIDEAKENGVSEILLNNDGHGIGLFKKYGFVNSENTIILNFSELLKKNIADFEKYGCHIHKCGCWKNIFRQFIKFVVKTNFINKFVTFICYNFIYFNKKLKGELILWAKRTMTR